MASLPAELLDILHRIIHSSAAAEVEKTALHEAVSTLENAETPVKGKG
jgi:hypothetical protein